MACGFGALVVGLLWEAELMTVDGGFAMLPTMYIGLPLKCLVILIYIERMPCSVFRFLL